MSVPVVAISSAYGAGGRTISQQVAEALGVPFLDQLQTPAELVARTKESSAFGLARHTIRGDMAVDDKYMGQMYAELASADALQASDAEVDAALTGGGVILGRGAPHRLEHTPGVLRVLLTGPVDARIAAAVRRDGLDEATAAENQRAYDASRTGIAAAYYGDDPDRVGQYHLVIDTTALGDALAVRFILDAQRALAAGTAG